MLPATTAHVALLNTCRNDTTKTLWRVDLYTFTDISGAVIARWTDADIDVSFGGNTWLHTGPGFDRGQITRQCGTQSSQLSITLQMQSSITVNGIPVAAFVANNGFFGATMQLERAYGSVKGKVVGTLPKFKGTVTQLQDTGSTLATLVVSNRMSLLNVQVPVNQWQPSCLHLVFDAGCRLNRVDFAHNGSVIGGSDPLNIFTTLIDVADGYLNLGHIDFLSGANKGLTRTIKVQNAGGAIALVRPLPSAPQPGDTFVAYPGCDLTMEMCKNKFNNLARDWSFPFIPLNEVAAP